MIEVNTSLYLHWWCCKIFWNLLATRCWLQSLIFLRELHNAWLAFAAWVPSLGDHWLSAADTNHGQTCLSVHFVNVENAAGTNGLLFIIIIFFFYWLFYFAGTNGWIIATHNLPFVNVSILLRQCVENLSFSTSKLSGQLQYNLKSDYVSFR